MDAAGLLKRLKVMKALRMGYLPDCWRDLQDLTNLWRNFWGFEKEIEKSENIIIGLERSCRSCKDYHMLLPVTDFFFMEDIRGPAAHRSSRSITSPVLR